MIFFFNNYNKYFYQITKKILNLLACRKKRQRNIIAKRTSKNQKISNQKHKTKHSI